MSKHTPSWTWTWKRDVWRLRGSCTPGPWSIGRLWRCIGAAEGVVCNVLISPAWPGNGRLIAAAPETGCQCGTGSWKRTPTY